MTKLSSAVQLPFIFLCFNAQDGSNSSKERDTMKIKWIISPLVAIALIAGCMTEKAEHQNKQANLMARAKVSKDAAEKIALAKVPGGTIKDSELEKEHGRLQ